jgi:opacity protein-like surface antigen
MMNRNACLFASTLLAIATSAVARAEGFVDLRVGGSFTEDADTELTVLGVPVGSGDADIEDSVTGGGRAGYWFDSLPWVGLAADASYFAADSDPGTAEIDVIPVSPLLMLRAPVAQTEEFPHGRLQPFLGVGPGIFITEIDADSGYRDDELDVGVDLHAGAKVLVTPQVGLFLQYRFTSFEADYSDTIPAVGVPIETEIDLDTHHVAGGVAFHF